MSEALKTLRGVTAYEWRRRRQSPVWILGLLAAVLWLFFEGRSEVGWPPANTSLYAYQLVVSLLLGIIAFLLAAGSLTRDVSYPQNELVFSRPISMAVFLGGKQLGAVSLVLSLVGVLVAISICRPCFSGVWTVYSPKPFFLTLLLCHIPLVLYTCALGVFLAALTGKLIVAFPLFLLYWFWAAILHGQGSTGVDLLDFTMRLYPREMTIDVPIRLTDYSFGHLLNPIEPLLIARCALYVALSFVLLAAATWILVKRRASQWSFSRRKSRLFGWRLTSVGKSDAAA